MDTCEGCGEPCDGEICQPCIDRAVARLSAADLAAVSPFGVWALAVELGQRGVRVPA